MTYLIVGHHCTAICVKAWRILKTLKEPHYLLILMRDFPQSLFLEFLLNEMPRKPWIFSSRTQRVNFPSMCRRTVPHNWISLTLIVSQFSRIPLSRQLMVMWTKITRRCLEIIRQFWSAPCHLDVRQRCPILSHALSLLKSKRWCRRHAQQTVSLRASPSRPRLCRNLRAHRSWSAEFELVWNSTLGSVVCVSVCWALLKLGAVLK